MFVQVSKPSQWEQSLQKDFDHLWSGLRNGDEESLSALFCASYSQLFDYGANIVPKESFVKDCIQELFLVLWDKRNNINEAHSVKSYMFYSLRRIMLRNMAKQRNRSKRNKAYVDTYFERSCSIEDLIVHFETQKGRKKAFSKAMEALSSRQKEAIYLKFYDGLSNDEIAYVMDINQQSVYNHVSEAIGKLQEFVKV